MFMGQYQHSVDARGRLFIPSKLKEGLGDRFYAAPGLETCLWVFPPKEWEAIGEKLHALPLSNSAGREFTRVFFSGAAECEADAQGRILLPAHLREYAQIDKDAVIIGVTSRVEIWSAGRWEQYRKKAQASFEETAEKLLDF